MEEVHRAGVGKDPELPWALGASSFYTSTCSPARSSPLRLGFSAEASLCRHDWLTHCPLVINSTSNPPCPPPRDLGGMQSSNLLISGWLPWQGGPVLGCPGASSHQLPGLRKKHHPSGDSKGLRSCEPGNRKGREWAETNYVSYYGRTGLCSSEAVFVDTAIWISFRARSSWDVLLACFHYIMWRPFLAQRLDLTHRPTPRVPSGLLRAGLASSDPPLGSPPAPPLPCISSGLLGFLFVGACVARRTHLDWFVRGEAGKVLSPAMLTDLTFLWLC